MSVHSKRKLPDHTHSRQDIVDTVPSAQVRPVPQPIQLRDIIVDGSFTLGSTIVPWTKYFECTQPPITKTGGTTEETDATATGSKCVKNASARPAEVAWNIAAADRVTIGEGEFYAVFMAKVGSNASSTSLIKIGMWKTGAGSSAGERTVKPNEFTASGQWQKFAVKFTAEANGTYDIWGERLATGVTDIYWDWVGIIPANVPLDNTGITNPNEPTGITVPAAPSQTIATTSAYSAGATSVNSDIWTDLITITVPNVDHDMYLIHSSFFIAGDASSVTFFVQVRVYDETDAIYYPTLKCRIMQNSTAIRIPMNFLHTLPKNVKNHSLKIQLYHSQGTTLTFWGNADSWGHSPHVHIPVDPEHTHIPTDPQHEH